MLEKATNRLKGLLLLTTAGATLLLGCVRQDQQDCYFPLDLQFTYTYNTEGRDLFDAEVPTLDLFLYDLHDGRLVDRRQMATDSLSADNTLRWIVPQGDYRVVAWGGAQQRYEFRQVSSFAQAQQHIRDVSPEGLVTHRREHLFHAMTADVTIDGRTAPARVMDLRKNTNDILVTVAGLTADQQRRVRCTISSANGVWTFENRCAAEQETVYQPHTSYADDEVRFDFTVLPLWAGDSSRLLVEWADQPAGRSGGTIYQGSLSGLLLEKPGTDLELEDTFTIRLEAGPASDTGLDFTLYVNDWQVIDQSGGLG